MRDQPAALVWRDLIFLDRSSNSRLLIGRFARSMPAWLLADQLALELGNAHQVAPSRNASPAVAA
jgi:hypothetical protein